MTARRLLLLSAFLAATPLPAQTSRDTIDIAVGSPLVDYSSHAAVRTRAMQSMTFDGKTRMAPPIIWQFAFADSGGRSLLRIRSDAEDGAFPPRSYTFDKRTLALISGPIPVDPALAARAYLQPLSDVVVESLPKRVGAVYRVPLFDPRTGTVDTHLFAMLRREDVTVLGARYPNAWVVEERSADGSRRLGTLWLTDGPPYLARWVMEQPNGALVTLDQMPYDGRPLANHLDDAAARVAIERGYAAWGAARVALDTATFQRMLAPDFSVKLATGPRSRAEFLGMISGSPPGSRLARFDSRILTLEATGPDTWAAVITEKLETEQRLADGRTQRSFALWVTRDGWRRDGDRWYITFSHEIGSQFWAAGQTPPFGDW